MSAGFTWPGRGPRGEWMTAGKVALPCPSDSSSYLKYFEFLAFGRLCIRGRECSQLIVSDAEMACPTSIESLGCSIGTSHWQRTRCVREPRRIQGRDGPLRTERAVRMAFGNLWRHWVAVTAELGSLPRPVCERMSRGGSWSSLSASPCPLTRAGSCRRAAWWPEGLTPRGCHPGPRAGAPSFLKATRPVCLS